MEPQPATAYLCNICLIMQSEATDSQEQISGPRAGISRRTRRRRSTSGRKVCCMLNVCCNSAHCSRRFKRLRSAVPKSARIKILRATLCARLISFRSTGRRGSTDVPRAGARAIAYLISKYSYSLPRRLAPRKKNREVYKRRI